MARKQKEIPGTERPSVPEIDEAAEAYRDVRDERMETQKVEADRKATLLQTVKQHGDKLVPNADGEKVYRFSDGEFEFDVIYAATENVKVRKAKGASADAEIG